LVFVRLLSQPQYRFPQLSRALEGAARKSSTVAATVILAAVPREVVVPGVMTGPLIQPAVAGQVVVNPAKGFQVHIMRS
jgi:hypothetical protein